jgi:hypothetical protein
MEALMVGHRVTQVRCGFGANRAAQSLGRVTAVRCSAGRLDRRQDGFSNACHAMSFCGARSMAPAAMCAGVQTGRLDIRENFRWADICHQ